MLGRLSRVRGSAAARAALEHGPPGGDRGRTGLAGTPAWPRRWPPLPRVSRGEGAPVTRRFDLSAPGYGGWPRPAPGRVPVDDPPPARRARNGGALRRREAKGPRASWPPGRGADPGLVLLGCDPAGDFPDPAGPPPPWSGPSWCVAADLFLTGPPAGPTWSSRSSPSARWRGQ